MIQIQVEDKTKAFEALANSLSAKRLNTANVRAINVAIRKANTNYRRQLVEKYNLKYADTKEMVSAKRATYGAPEGSVSGQSSPISLSRFNPSFQNAGQVFSIKSVKKKETGKRGLAQLSKNATGKNATIGVSFEVKKGQRKTLPFAFMIQSDKPGIMQQIWARGSYTANLFTPSKNRMPITPLKTVSPFGAMATEPIQKDIRGKAEADLQKEFERQVNLMLRTAGAR